MLAGLAAPEGETRPTSEDKSALVDKQMAVVAPFGCIAIYWPAFAELGDTVAIEDITLGAIDVAPNGRLRLFLGDVVHHTGWKCLVGRLKVNTPLPRLHIQQYIYNLWLPLPTPGSLDMTSSPTVVEAGCQS